ncbi:hypothetical protein KSP40_PGU006033 [Platanthera guangdongensis]|uniref:RWD domain-containing protein n=1 Tax=Platanthera guangdongensis TaxID=2320717 RepID=A0ABR2M6R6_9ASPA
MACLIGPNWLKNAEFVSYVGLTCAMMGMEAIEIIRAHDVKRIKVSEAGLGESAKIMQIRVEQEDGDNTESGGGIGEVPVIMRIQLALIFSHTKMYPDEPPLLNVKSIRGIKPNDLTLLQEKLGGEASENLGMSMIYTLANSAKDWLHEKYGQIASDEVDDEPALTKDDIIIPHGEPVTVETFFAWRERFEAELALQRAKLMPESALASSKEKKLSGRQWFESGRASAVIFCSATVAAESEEEEEEEIDFDDDFEDDDDEMLEHYLTQKSEKPSEVSDLGSRIKKMKKKKGRGGSGKAEEEDERRKKWNRQEGEEEGEEEENQRKKKVERRRRKMKKKWNRQEGEEEGEEEENQRRKMRNTCSGKKTRRTIKEEEDRRRGGTSSRRLLSGRRNTRKLVSEGKNGLCF